MEQSFWQRQVDKPLFPELEWSRPETKQQAGKLLIIGGSATGFVEPSEAYTAAEKAGIGISRMLLPDSLRKYVGKTFTAGELAPTTPSGSFGKAALASFVDEAAWADGVLLAGGIGRNSETAILLESFLEKYHGQITLTKDAADVFCQQPISILHRPNTLLVMSMGQLRRLGSEARFPRAFTSEMDLVQLVDALHEFTKRFTLSIITRHQNQFVVATAGQVSTTKLREEQPIWRLRTAATASVWWIQNPSKTFEAFTAALYEVSKTNP
jgi:NAD(P)H-hydrate repair Nnr-like enzyme with NAD(P)H-hydrate dehydratase domain